MNEIKSFKSKDELPKEDEKEVETIEEEQFEDEFEEKPLEVFRATEKDERVHLIAEINKKLAKKLNELAECLECSKRELIAEALENLIAKYEDLSFLDHVLSDDSVDNIIARMKEKQVTVLMPKAYLKIKRFLSGRWSLTQGDKWQEFLRKMHLEDEEKPTSAYYIKWK